MNRALGYLWFSLLKRQAWQFLRSLRRPTTAIGFAALAGFGWFLFHYRHEEAFGQLVRRESLIGGAMVMLGGSLLKGFLERGLVFQPPDLEFLFTSPFTQRQIVFYRMLPHYLFAVAQGAVFFILFASHLAHPFVAAACLTLFQMACFHLGAGAAIFAGTLSEAAHHRIRWMLLGIYFVLTALYLRLAWDLKLVPAIVASPLTQILFYPALTISEIGAAPVLREWAVRLVQPVSMPGREVWQPMLYLCLFAAGTVASLWVLLRMKANIFEMSLATTARVAERRLRLRQGRSITTESEGRVRSARLPGARLFGGVRAIVWKNLVVATRSRRGLMVAAAFTAIYTGSLIALRWSLHHYMAEGAELPPRTVLEFDNGLAAMLCFVPFLLQRAFSFDFRRDGDHLLGFRTLPVSAFGLVLAELAVPTILCLAFQAAGILVMLVFSGFDWRLLLLTLAGFPAVALALNGVWNVHYLLAATKRAGGKAEATSPVALLMVVSLSFLIFYPAGWAALQIGRTFGETTGIAGWLVIQYGVDFLLVLLLGRLFERFEVSRDAA